MINKKVARIILIVLSFGLVVSLLSATTYALFSNDAYGSNPNAFSTGTLSIEVVSKSEVISLDNALPMKDEEGVQTTPYIFTVRNSGSVDYLFDIKLLSTDDDNNFSSSYIKLQVNDGEVKTLSQLTNSIIMSQVLLKAGESMDVSLRVWLDWDTPNSELGKSFNSEIVTTGNAVYTDPVVESGVKMVEVHAPTGVSSNAPTYTNLTTYTATGNLDGSFSDAVSITVNGQEAIISDNVWSYDLSLTHNTLTEVVIVAVDANGYETTQRRYVFCDTSDPSVTVDFDYIDFGGSTADSAFAMPMSTVTVTGTVSDPESGIKYVDVAGVKATVNSNGTWTANVPISSTEATQLTVVAVNNAGASVDITNANSWYIYDPNITYTDFY